MMQDDFLRPEIRCDFQVSEKRKKIWKVQLELLSQLDRVCKKYNLRYFASNGTLLGAVRHHGFVPWDDDMDMMMPRPDYEKLVSVAGKEFTMPIYFQDSLTHALEYYRLWGRLRNANTTAATIPMDMRHPKLNGIFIDIFPLDGVSHCAIIFKAQSVIIKVMNKMANYYIYQRDQYRLVRKKLWVKLAGVGINFFFMVFSYERFLAILRKIRKKVPYGSTQGVFACTHGTTITMKKADVNEILWVDFERGKMPIPAGFDVILKQLYGNYMELPPISERGKRHSIFFDPDKPYSAYYEKISPKEAWKRMNDY